MAIREKLQKCTNPINPEHLPKETVNNGYGKVSNDAVNVDHSIEKGHKLMGDLLRYMVIEIQ